MPALSFGWTAPAVFLLTFPGVILSLLPHPAQADSKVGALSPPDYVGQLPPGRVPEVFAPGVVSTGIHEHSAAVFSPDGEDLFFSGCGVVPHTLFHMRCGDDGTWTRPEVASFSGYRMDDQPVFTDGGSRLYFNSRRPHGETLQDPGVSRRLVQRFCIRCLGVLALGSRLSGGEMGGRA